MKADPRGVLTGAHFMDGDHACCEGALAAGCRFVAGYPITPSTEVVERIATRFPSIGGIFIQMEDELAASIAILGGAWAGAKVMTVTSGPGFSLMMEHLGLAIMTETPSVFVNVQRGGPSTGLPTLPGQADMMQARWGSHGDYEIIAICPSSPQECFDFTVLAFNLAETYRVPVLMMMDECVGHMTEKVVIPKAEDIVVTPRKFSTAAPGSYKPYQAASDADVPDMAKAGQGHRFHITGLTHDDRGYPVMNPTAQDKLIRRLINKIKLNADNIWRMQEDGCENADVIVVSYGITARVAQKAIQAAKAEGIKVGSLKLITVWPFPEKRIRELTSRIKGFVVPEINMGQIVLEVERCAGGRALTRSVPHAGGSVHNPERILEAIREVAK